MGDSDQGNTASDTLQPVVSPDHGSVGNRQKAGAKTATQSTVDLTKDNPTSSPNSAPTNPFAASDSKVPTEGQHPIYQRGYSLAKLHHRVQKSFRVNSFSNGRLNAWNPTVGAALPTRNQVFHQPVIPPFPNKITWEQVAVGIYHNAHGKGVWEIDDLLKNLFKPPIPDPPNFDINDGDWQHRVFFLGLAYQCPATLFDLLGQEALFRSQTAHRFWDFTDASNPILLLNPEDPLPILWVLSSMFFSHPWTGPEQSPLVVEEFELRTRQQQQKKAHAKTQAQRPPPKKRPASSPKTNPRAPKVKDHRPSPGRPMATDDHAPAVTFDESAATSAPASVANSVPGTGSPGVSTATTTSATNPTTPNRATATAPSTPTRPSLPAQPAPTPTTAATPQAGSSVPPPPPPLQRHGQLTSGSTFSEVAAAPAASTRPKTTLEKVAALTQSCVTGLPFKHAHIFNVNIGFHWEGASAGTRTSHQTVYQSIRRFAEGIFNEIGTDIVILPLSDGRYKSRSTWIQSLAVFDSKIPDFAAVQPYIDPSFGNPYISDQVDKIGKKILKSRMRFGFNKPPAVVRKALKNLLSHHKWAGCEESPLQTSDMSCLGFFPMYAHNWDTSALVRFIIRLLDYKCAVGFHWEWVRNPRGSGIIQWNKTNSRGLQMWHIYAPSDFAEEVDRALRKLFHPNTPKADFPYGCCTQYVHDWQSAVDGVLSIGPVPQLARLIGTMRERTRVFHTMTDQLSINLELHGMLVPTQTTHFGKITLLKLLYSIVVTPVQAAQAEAAATKAPTTAFQAQMESAIGADDLDSDDEVQITNVKAAPTPATTDATTTQADLGPQSPTLWTKVTSAASTTPPKVRSSPRQAPQTPEEEAAWAMDLLQLDISNTNPGPLPVYLTPLGIDAYGVTVRKKYFALATNVFSNLTAFLKFHLREPTHAAFISVIKNWMALDEAERNQRGNIVWFPSELRSKCVDQSTSDGRQVEDSLDFLMGVDDDPMEHVEGTLHIDVNMASVRDIDDGATVAGALDELREAQEGLVSALEQNDQLQDENAKLQARLRQQQALIEANQAEMARVQRAFAHSSAAQAAAAQATTPAPTSDDPGGSSQNQSVTGRGGGSSTQGP